jgi:uncharacterized protein YbaR (Trm112 family)
VLAPSFLAQLVCPVSHGKLIYFPDDQVLVCPASKLRYRIENDYPVMLPDEAQKLSDAEIAALIAQAKRLGLPIPT